MKGFETFSSDNGHWFRIISPNGIPLCSSPSFASRQERDEAVAMLIRTVIVHRLCSVLPENESIIVIRYDGVAAIPHEFMQGWSAALRAHLEINYGKRVSVIFMPEGIDFECFTDNDLTSLGLKRIMATEEKGGID